MKLGLRRKITKPLTKATQFESHPFRSKNLQIQRMKNDEESRTWVLRFGLRGKDRWYGPADGKDAVTLAEARKRALLKRIDLRYNGVDPIEKRKQEKAVAALTNNIAVMMRQPTTQSPQPRPGARRRGRADDRPYSSLMLAARITLPHFSVCSTMNLSNSSVEIGNGSAPRSARWTTMF